MANVLKTSVNKNNCIYQDKSTYQEKKHFQLYTGMISFIFCAFNHLKLQHLRSLCNQHYFKIGVNHIYPVDGMNILLFLELHCIVP